MKLNGKKIQAFKYRSNPVMFFAAILFQLSDIFSTILCVKMFGYGYEANIFIREIIHSTGIFGFAVIKFCLAFLALFITYTIIKHRDSFGWKNVNMFYGIYIGTIISGIFVTISNLSVVYAGSPLYFLNFNALHIAILLLFMAPLAGLFLDMMNIPKKTSRQQNYVDIR